MILDSIENLSRYTALQPLFEKVVQFLKLNDINTLSFGKHIIDGENIYLNIVEAAGRDVEDAAIEIHKEYIDIQLPLSKKETFGYNSLSNLKILSKEYDNKNDIAFYKDMCSSFLDVEPGQFIVFFPKDGHMPCIYKGNAKKAIFKVKFQHY
ncbi:MAG: YhcH/YjgK/YiaL family protein [Bacteroidales bacterium]|nr:YhcH/YjgK/YiaL family protein [Bacteroidales bacterium]